MSENIITIDTEVPIWERFYTVAPLTVIGTKEGKGYDLAPKHMVTPLGWDNYFGFVCTPRHGTYHNVKEHGVFTVSYTRPNQLILASLAATPRCGKGGEKPVIEALPTFSATKIDGVFITDAYLFLECQLEKIIDGFGINSLITGKIIAAHVHKDALRESEVDDEQLIFNAPLMAYLYPGRFASIQATRAFPFPANFKNKR